MAMGRSKERGKPVGELTLVELRTEAVRCKAMIRAFPKSVAAKSLRKRLRQIEICQKGQ